MPITEKEARDLRGDPSKSYATEKNIAPNLFLRITPKGAKSWRFVMDRVVPETGKTDPVRLGLGSWDIDECMPANSGSRTWDAAVAYARKLKKIASGGGCPRIYHETLQEALVPVKTEAELEAEAEGALKTASERKKSITVHDACMAYLKSNPLLLSDGTIKHWTMTLSKYLYPSLGKRKIHLVGKRDVLDIIEPMWITKNETAERVRQRLATVIDWAKDSEYIDAAQTNPADKKSLAFAIPSRKKVREEEKKKGIKRGNPALLVEHVPTFWRELEPRWGMNAKALRFKMLTLVRTKEIRFTDWSEIDIENREWNIPAGRMKGGIRAHTVALTDAAIEVLKTIPGGIQKSGPVFVQKRGLKSAQGKPIAQNAMYALMLTMGYKGIAAPHGMRNAFKTWSKSKEQLLRFHPAVCEAVLAHIGGTSIEKTYDDPEQHQYYLEHRYEVMQAWGEFVMSAPAEASSNVTPITAKRKPAAKKAA